MENISIGKIAEKTGLTLRAIRYYEELGLIASSPVRRGNARTYPYETIPLLHKIKVLKETGFSLEKIRTVLKTLEEGRTQDKETTLFLRETLTTTVNEIRAKRKLLEDMEKSLTAALEETVGCDACETPNPEKDCRGCENLALLRSFGLTDE